MFTFPAARRHRRPCLNGLIMLQKKIDGEKIDMPMLGREGNTPWYRDDVERDIPVPVLGPDLIDLRTVEIAAERTAAGLLDQHEAGLPSRRRSRRQQPETEAAAEEAARGRPKAPSKIDLIRAKARGEAAPDGGRAAPAPPAEAKAGAGRQARQEV